MVVLLYDNSVKTYANVMIFNVLMPDETLTCTSKLCNFTKLLSLLFRGSL